jgi:hypothetical protein
MQVMCKTSAEEGDWPLEGTWKGGYISLASPRSGVERGDIKPVSSVFPKRFQKSYS